MPYVEASVRSRQFVAAARRVMVRDGVANTSLRAVAAEAQVPLGTLQYVFPSKEKLLRAAIEDVVDEIAEVLASSVRVDGGMALAIRQGAVTFWSQLVADQVNLQLMQHELLNHMLRAPGQQHLARRQYERYIGVITDWGRVAAANSREVCGVPFERLARIILAGIDGLILQYASNPDRDRAHDDLEALIDMVIAAAQIRPA